MYTLDLTIFDKWTPNLAWILGYLWADGSISSTPPMRCCVATVRSDVELLLHVKRILSADQPLWIDNKHYMIHLRLSSPGLLSILQSKYKIEPRKSFKNLPFPCVPKRYLGHFLRGYFDGDGSAHIATNGYLQIDLVGQFRFIKGLQLAVCNRLNIKRNRIYRRKECNCSQFSWYSRADIEKLCDFMYAKQNIPCLRRKRNKIETYLELKKGA